MTTDAPPQEDTAWLRLDKRMLLVHPVTETIKFLPVLLASIVFGSQMGNHFWGLGALVVIVGYALLRWFTTTYRIGPVNIELRTGVFEKKLLSIPRSRIRSVDVEAHLMHRVLGLAIVRIGTGTGRSDEKFQLNALDAALIPALRAELLTTTAVAPEHRNEIAHFSPTWVRYAPFSSTGVVAVLALTGIVFQYGIGERLIESDAVSGAVDSAAHAGIVAAVLVAIIVLLVVASALACVRYLLAFGNLTVVDEGAVLHVSHGLLKTRATSLDRTRLRGSTLHEPLLLRLARGAHLDAIMTGVSAAKAESSLVLPQSPAVEARRVMGRLIGDTAPATITLTAHGPAAARRRATRAALPVAALLVGVAVLAAFAEVPVVVWVVVALAVVTAPVLAWDRYRGLGHAILPGWLVTQRGSLARRRDSVQAGGIVAWTVRQSFFQRRAGVATIVAATAAGRGHYEVVDLPAADAWALVEAVQPGAGDVWVRTDGPE